MSKSCSIALTFFFLFKASVKLLYGFVLSVNFGLYLLMFDGCIKDIVKICKHFVYSRG